MQIFVNRKNLLYSDVNITDESFVDQIFTNTAIFGNFSKMQLYFKKMSGTESDFTAQEKIKPVYLL